MHTTHIEHEGEEFTLLHNGDFSGDVKIVVPENDKYRVTDDSEFPDSTPTHYEVELPFAVVKEMVAAWLRHELVAKYEDIDAAELFGHLMSHAHGGTTL